MADLGWEISNFGSINLGLIVIDTILFDFGFDTEFGTNVIPVASRNTTISHNYSSNTDVSAIYPEIAVRGSPATFGSGIGSYYPVIVNLNPTAKTFGIQYQRNPNASDSNFFFSNHAPRGYVCYVKGI